jgi:hypothetical protein
MYIKCNAAMHKNGPPIRIDLPGRRFYHSTALVKRMWGGAERPRLFLLLGVICVRKTIRFLAVGLFVLALAAVGAFYAAWRATQHVPEFYQVAIQKQPEVHVAAAQRLEQKFQALHQEVRRTGRWEATFTDEQINGWLAADLPAKFPNVLPKGVSEPRVAIQPEEAKVACRYQTPKVETVFSMGVEVALTEEPNVVAVRIRAARAGLMPIPLDQLLKHATKYAHKSEVPLRWTQEDGDPVALVTVPSERKEFIHRKIHIETVELRDGAVYLAGRTDDSELAPAPAVRQASYVRYGESENLHR